MKNLFWTLLLLLCSCKTSLEKSKNSQTFMVIGDLGWVNGTEQTKTAQTIQRIADSVDVDFMATTGDNFYYNGVQSTEDSKWSERFENMYLGVLKEKDWYISVGNHDYEGSVQAQIDYQQKNNRWILPKRYYAVEKTLQKFPKSKILLVFLDTSPFDKNLHLSGYHSDVTQQDTTLQKKWLDSTLANSQAQWKIVFGHHPLYTAGPRKGTMGNYIQTFKPIFDKYKVDFYIAGHEHNLGYLKPDSNHTDYIVSGGGGADITPISDYEYAKFYVSSYGVVFFRIEPLQTTITFFNNRKEKLYQYTKTK